MPVSFAHKLIAWQKRHGRHDLPWQDSRNPYAIWVSEIMLQQTQVATVIPYYKRFIQRFPDISALALATEQDVLTCWAGLGYYARGRNLHKAAQIIQDLHSGTVSFKLRRGGRPSGCRTLHRRRHLRLRLWAAARHPGRQRQARACPRLWRQRLSGREESREALWQLSRSLLPEQELATYTQGLMDLGATVCTRSKPRCERCPLRIGCKALQENRIGELPGARPRKSLPEKHAQFLVIHYGPDLLLEKRPAPGIWGGLWSLPEAGPQTDPAQACLQVSGQMPARIQALPALSHSFTHFKLHIQPLQMTLPCKPIRATESASQIWMPLADALHAALPKAVEKILRNLAGAPGTDRSFD